MSTAMMSRSSWGVKDEAILTELVGLLGLTEPERAALASLQSAAAAVGQELLDEFYGRLHSSDNTREYFEGVDMAHLQARTKDWFLDLFSGQYDAGYARKRLAIGQIHVRIGLPVRYPLAMIDVVMKYGDRACASAADPQVALTAFRKVLALDVAVFNQAYEDNQLKHLSELVGGERLARLLLSGQQ